MVRDLCCRYGPGRLPYASRRDIGGGVAMAATGLLAASLWFGGIGLLLAIGMRNGTIGFFFGVGLFFVPLVIPASFIIGTLLWRNWYPEENHQFYGALFSGLTALSSLAVGSLGPALFLAVSNVIDGDMAILEALLFLVLLLPIGFLFAIVAAGWLVLPLGVFGGWYHERAKTGSEKYFPSNID